MIHDLVAAFLAALAAVLASALLTRIWEYFRPHIVSPFAREKLAMIKALLKVTIISQLIGGQRSVKERKGEAHQAGKRLAPEAAAPGG